MIVEKIEKDLKNMVSSKRYKHILGVASTAALLGNHYGISEERLRIAALLHDIMKEQSLERLNELCSREKFKELKGYEKSNEILHGFAAAEYAKEHYGIADVEILDGVRYHTIGRKNMTLFEKIVYLADAIEPERDYGAVEKIRELAYKDIDEALLYEINQKIEYLIKTDRIIHVNALKMRNSLLKKRGKRDE